MGRSWNRGFCEKEGACPPVQRLEEGHYSRWVPFDRAKGMSSSEEDMLAVGCTEGVEGVVWIVSVCAAGGRTADPGSAKVREL